MQLSFHIFCVLSSQCDIISAMDEEVVASASESPLPESFLDFLNQNGLDPSIYIASHSTPRYIRYPFSSNYFILCAYVDACFSFFEFQWNNVFMLTLVNTSCNFEDMTS